ncbi:MAG: hypothetical protein JAY90_19070 [Candidatus Thiodiazotropha lotti]|nr:hypothetical protein [Candidatus Thiodiazotropha lotti]
MLSATASDDGLPEPLDIGWQRREVIPFLNGTWLLNVSFSIRDALTTSISSNVEPVANRTYPITDSVTQTKGFAASDGWHTVHDTLNLTTKDRLYSHQQLGSY